VIGLTDILNWVLVCSGARLSIRCKINEKTQKRIFSPSIVYSYFIIVSIFTCYLRSNPAIQRSLAPCQPGPSSFPIKNAPS
jgi:hypothetical protein